MKRRFEGGKGDDDRPESSRRKGPGPRVDMPCVLKFLCPEVLASAVIGKGGAVIKQIREQTQAKLALTDHNQFYPGTDDRVLTCQAESQDTLTEVANIFVSKVSDCAQASPSDSLGEPGALKLRTLMPKAAVGGIIGRGGSAIKALRESSGANISIAEPIGGGPGAQQVVTISGPGQALEYAMVEINKQVQAVNTEPWWQDWAADTGVGGVPKGGGKGDKKGGKGKGKEWEGVKGPPAEDWGGNGYRDSRPRPGGGYGRGEHPGVAILMDHARNLPPYVLDDERGFALTCIVPNRLVGGLIGRGGSGTKDVQNMTGTKIGIREIPGDPENRHLNIAGPLAHACAAYMLMMKRYLDAEAQQGAPPPMGPEGGRSGRR